MPNWNHIVRAHLAALRLPPEREIEIVEEMALCFEALYEDALADGLSEADAEARAVQGYDWRLLESELSRAEQPPVVRALRPSLELIERRGGAPMESLLQDLRFGARMLAKNPGYTLIAMLTLALGIGATTAIFSVVNAVLLRPLPYDNPERLVMIWETNAKERNNEATASFDDFTDFRRANQSFEQIGATTARWPLNLTEAGEARQVGCIFVSANVFPMLGVKPQAGRFFTDDEDKPGGPDVVVLSHSLWITQFGGRQDLIGQTIRLGGIPATVIGVAPAGFQLLEPAELWRPLARNPVVEANAGRAVRLFNIVGRLKAGATVEQAQAEIAGVAHDLEQQFPNTNSSIGARVVSLHEQVTGKVNTLLWLLLGAVVLVLLIACVNVANLTLAQASARQKEIAIRLALGAGRRRLIRQLLAESSMLAVISGALGTLLAVLGIDLLLALSPGDLPRQSNIHIDWAALSFALSVSLLTGLVAGLAPAFQSSGGAVGESLKESGKSATAGWRQQRLRAALVVSEMALALILLAGAGLLVKSFARLLEVRPGFLTENILIFNANLPEARFSQPQQRAEFYRQIEERFKTLPDVSSFGVVTRLPIFSPANNNITTAISVEGKPIPEGQQKESDFRRASNDYFQTMGIPLMAGRGFSNQDGEPNQPATAIINEAMAARFWPGENPLGKRFRSGPNSDQSPWITVVGIVGNVRHLGLEIEPRPEIYRHHLTSPPRSPIFVVRTKTDPRNLFASVRNLVKQIDREIAVADLTTMQEQVALSLATRRFTLTLFSVFGAVALLLAAVGLYAVMSYSVAQRTRELGVRAALGAQAADLLRLVVRQGMSLVLLGVAIGAMSALALTRLMENLLFSVRATDPLTLTLAAALLAFVALLACLFPARRATKVDPLTAVRHD
jgi:putative ABC transport system permease protein